MPAASGPSSSREVTRMDGQRTVPGNACCRWAVRYSMTLTLPVTRAVTPEPATIGELGRMLARLEWTLLDFSRRELVAGGLAAIPGGHVRFHYVVEGAVEVSGGDSP